MANYLVTGGAGFIGSHISETLVQRGHRVRVADNFITGYQRNIRDGVEFLEGDCADPAFAKQIVAGMDYVIHQAAIPSVPRSVEKPLESHRANVD
ncbi:MAG TPA: NAD-dependent epimerase/dehydratase family protein, partial [Vicinamibacterales bacterium]|nr:NAD-dependent epimerase/dehydratase family protein [Vicinamibacterales bacterium]